MSQEQDPNKDEDKGFKVEDKRRFDAEGRSRDEDVASAAETEAATQVGAGGEAAEKRREGQGITFTSFVVGLATQALAFLGAVPAREGAAMPKNPGEAAALIDILAMLRDKTAGNLAEDEERLMEEVLYDLRMRYVEEVRGGSPGSGENA